VGFDVRFRDAPAAPGYRGRAFWIYKFPCLLLHFSAHGFNVERVMPLGPQRIRLRRWSWATDERPGGQWPDAEVTMRTSRNVMEEDLANCEAVQRNLRAGIYLNGRLVPSKEPGTAHFQQLVRAALTDRNPAES
jgi:choline monooxygenase